MGGIFTVQPFKALWVLLAVTLNAVRLPLWILIAAIPALRQKRDWTFRQSVRVRIVRAFVYNSSIVEMKTPLSLQQGKEGNRFVVLDPAPKKCYQGPTIKDPEIQPEKVGATWYPERLVKHRAGNALVVLHHHGGAYAIGDGREHDAGFLARTLVSETPATHVLCPQYRLSSNPGGRYPAALQDAITCLSHLVNDLGLSPKQIVVSGDSAGANLTLSLLKYITDHPASGFKPPICAWLFSCWVSPGNAANNQQINHSPNYHLDYITERFGWWGASNYAPAPVTGLTIEDPGISFGGNPFSTQTSLYFSAGECEILFHDIVDFVEQMRTIKSNKLQLQIEDRAVHDIMLIGHLSGFVEEAKLSARRAGTYLAGLSKA